MSHIRNWIKNRCLEKGMIDVQLSSGIRVPIISSDGPVSLREVFIEREYEVIDSLEFKQMKWLDLGSNCGMFSLYVYDHLIRKVGNSARSAHALLVDPDPRSQKAYERIREINPELVNMHFLHAAYSASESPLTFEERPQLSSGVRPASGAGGSNVQGVKFATITQQLGGPYDVIKVDIEGWEVDFLDDATDLADQCRCLLIEWHSWNEAGLSVADFERRLKRVFREVDCGRICTFPSDHGERSCANLVCRS